MHRRYILAFLSFTVFLLAAACQNNTATPKNDGNKQIQVEQSSYESDLIMNNEQIADHLATIASEVTDVHDAVAIVAGPYAVVAIDIDETVERQETGMIKYTVIEAMEHDPYGKSAVVVADADLWKRIKEMKQSVQDGAATEGIADELGTIVSRYMPTFPIREPDVNKPDEEQNLPEKERIVD